MKNACYFILFLCLALYSHSTFAQTYTVGPEEYMSWEEFITDYLDEIDTYAESNQDEPQSHQEILEELEEIRNNPININTAKKNDFLLIPFLNETQVDSILSYRNKKHLFYSLGELQWIDNIPYTTRCRLSLFVFAGDTLRQKVSLSTKLFKGKHTIISRFDLPLYSRAGDRSYTQNEINEHPSRYFTGYKFANTTRYRYQWKKDVTYGITLQKDSGEPFAAQNNYPYDYTSFYFHYRPTLQQFEFWLGDYNLHAGEGLLFGNAFFFGPLQLTENATFQQSRIRPHTSSDEISYFRGIATAYKIKQSLTLSAFASFRKLDGTLENDTLMSLKTDGLHRTMTEINNRRTFGNFVIGSRISYKKYHWHIGANAYWSQYTKTIYPPVKTYNRHYLRGKSAAGLSLDYSWKSRRWQISGETASDKDFHLSTTNTFRFLINSANSLSLQQRSFSSRFVAPFGKTLQDNAHIQNEYGLMLGISSQPFDKIHVTSYIDYHYHPQPVYRADHPSKGVDFLLSSKYSVTRNFNLSLRYKFKTKEQDVTGHKNIMQYVSSHRGRISANYSTKHFSSNMAFDCAVASQQVCENSFGWMISSRNSLKISKQFKAHAFAAVFFTDDYASRLYAYEPQLQYASSFPTFAYHGFRLASVIQWNFFKHGYAALRYGWIKYFNRDKIGSGTQEINTNHKHDLSLQCGLTF